MNAPKTYKSFITLCESISSVDLDEIKGVKTEQELELIGLIRAAVQNELSELKHLRKNDNN